jgi:hypothetical protein
VIGVYEPLTVVSCEGRRDTSLAAEPEVALTDEPIFHRACHALRSGLGGA